MRIENIAIQNTPKGEGGKAVDTDGFSRILKGLIFTDKKEVKKETMTLEKEKDKEAENLIEVEDETEGTDEVLGFFYPGDLEFKPRQVNFNFQGDDLSRLEDLGHGEVDIMNSEEFQSVVSEGPNTEILNPEVVDGESLDLESTDFKPLDLEALDFSKVFKQELDKPMEDLNLGVETIPEVGKEISNKPGENENLDETSIGLSIGKENPRVQVSKETSKDINTKADMGIDSLESREDAQSIGSMKLEEDGGIQDKEGKDTDLISSLEKEGQKPKESKFENILIDSGFSRVKAPPMEGEIIIPEIEEFGLENIHRVTETIVESIKISKLDTSNFMEVQLYPEELGALNIKLKLEDGKITGKILVANDMVKGLLVNSLSELNQNLAKENINLEKLEIDINTGLNGNLAGESFSENQNSRDFNQGLRNIFRRTSNTSIGSRESTAGVNQGWLSSGVNILV